MGLCVTGLQLTVTFFAFHLLQEGKRRAHTESTFERLTVSAVEAPKVTHHGQYSVGCVVQR